MAEAQRIECDVFPVTTSPRLLWGDIAHCHETLAGKPGSDTGRAFCGDFRSHERRCRYYSLFQKYMLSSPRVYRNRAPPVPADKCARAPESAGRYVNLQGARLREASRLVDGAIEDGGPAAVPAMATLFRQRPPRQRRDSARRPPRRCTKRRLWR